MSAHLPLSPTPEPAPASGAGESPSFEAAMERLEVIVEQMENARLPLEELIRGYEEGTRLIRVCSERLSVAEQRIEIITRDAGGQPRVSEYPAPATGTPNAPVSAPKAGREAKPAPASPVPAPTAATPAVSRPPSKTPNEVSLF